MDTQVRNMAGQDPRHTDSISSPSRNPLPAVCDVSVTNVCNAACDFCGFSRDKKLAGPRRYLAPDEFERALPILRRRKIRYMTFQGGEPLVHPQIEALVASATKAGMQCGLITNGWFLSKHIEQLAAAGLKRLLISIDSASMVEHEHNRGLQGLGSRIADGVARAHSFGLPVVATVTVSRLVHYESLPETLTRLGFDAVAFSYPRREAFGSSSLVYDETSKLVDLSAEEILDALNEIARLKKRFRVMDPQASLADVARFVRGEQQLIPCVGGSKYFYLDWNLDIWRCEAWSEPMGSVFDFDRFPDQREPCNACMMSCYRHASALMHGPMAVADSAQALGRGDFRSAVSSLFQRGVATSLWALAGEELPSMSAASLTKRRAEFRAASKGELKPDHP